MALARSLPLLLIAGLMACAETPLKVCGESFCFPDGTALLSREAPVEDFDLYRVEADGDHFLIYDGNKPQRGRSSIVIPMDKVWPNFVEGSGPCFSPDNCAVKSFAAKITRR